MSPLLLFICLFLCLSFLPANAASDHGRDLYSFGFLNPGLWGLDRIDQAIGRDGSYNTDYLGQGVFIYVLDTGVDISNLNFVGRSESGITFYPLNLLHTPGDSDGHGHGTHVSSTALGTHQGVAKSATLVPVRVMDRWGLGDSYSTAAGIHWAVEHAAARGRRAIINLSVTTLTVAPPINNAVAYAKSKGVIVVAAAGNQGWDACEVSPASAEWAIAVGAVSVKDKTASFTNNGRCVDIYAPGVEIEGAIPLKEGDISGRTTAVWSGTSMASPHVAGIAALLWNKYPDWSANRIRQRVLDLAVTGALSCETGCNNVRLAQVPVAEVLIVDGLDLPVALSDFGLSPAYWPRLVGFAQIDGEPIHRPFWRNRTTRIPFEGGIAFERVEPLSAAYDRALLAQRELNAKAFVVVSPLCFDAAWSMFALKRGASIKEDLLRIPLLCTPSADAVLPGSVVEIGLAQRPQHHTPEYFAQGSALQGDFREWRNEWAATAMGVRNPNAESVCFAFDVAHTGREDATGVLRIAYSSDELFALRPEVNMKSALVNWYVVEVSNTDSWAVVFRNHERTIDRSGRPPLGLTKVPTRLTLAMQNDSLVLSSGVTGEILLNFSETRGLLPNLNYLSFSASHRLSLVVSNVRRCEERSFNTSVNVVVVQQAPPPPLPPSPAPPSLAPTHEPTAAPSAPTPRPTKRLPGARKCAAMDNNPLMCARTYGCRWQAHESRCRVNENLAEDEEREEE